VLASWSAARGWIAIAGTRLLLEQSALERWLCVLTTSIATFYNFYDKLRSLETGTFPILLANGLQGESYGVEAGASFQAREWWRLNAGYTFQRLDLETEPASSDTSQVKQESDSPRHRWFLQSSVSLPHDVALDLGVRWIGELPNQRVPAYLACDGRLGWQPSAAVEALQGPS